MAALFWELHRKPGQSHVHSPTRSRCETMSILMRPSLLMMAKTASKFMAVKVPEISCCGACLTGVGFLQKIGTLCALLDWWATSFAVALSSAQIEAALPFVQETFSEADLCRM